MANEIYKNGNLVIGSYTTSDSIGSQIFYNSGGWNYPGGAGPGNVITSTTGGNILSIKVPLIHGATLTGYVFTYNLAGANGRSVVNPMRVSSISSYNIATAVTTSLGGALNAVYTVAGSLVSTPLNGLAIPMDRIVNPNLNYYLSLIDESGTGQTAGNTVLGFQFTYTVNKPFFIE